MAYSSAAMSADEIARAAAGKPMISANTALPPGEQQWVVGTTAGDWGDPSDDATGFEARRAVDGLPGEVTKPDAASTQFTLIFDWSSNPIEFDWLGLMNHNLYSLTTTQLSLQVADDSLFTTNVATPTNRNISTSYSSDRRLADVNIGHAVANTRYSDVPYARLQIVCSSGTPEIGQVVFGRRAQQKYHPELEWGPDDQSSNIDRQVSPGGTRHKIARSKGRRDINGVLVHDKADLQSDLISWWADLKQGRNAFYWHDDATLPDDFYMFDLNEKTFRYPFTRWQTRQFELSGAEQGPDGQYYSQGP